MKSNTDSLMRRGAIEGINATIKRDFTGECVKCKMPTPPTLIDDKGLCPACGGKKKLTSTFYN